MAAAQNDSILDKSGLEVLLGTILDDLKDIKESLKVIPTNERVDHLENRIKGLEEIRNYLILAVSGLLINTIWTMITKGGG